MEYVLDSCVWEITMQCNYACRHCGSACGPGMPDELTTEEALLVADDLARLKPFWATLIGGEPLLRKDWHLIAQRLSTHGIGLGLITNGSIMDGDIVRKIIDSGIKKVGISLEGTEPINDFIRGAGTYAQIKNAIKILTQSEGDYKTVAVTTVVRENLDNLTRLRDELITMGVSLWQLQVGIYEGNMPTCGLSTILPKDMMGLITFAYEENKKGDIGVILTDGIGYNTKKEILARKSISNYDEYPVWEGCGAGVGSLGIMQNGDVVGCVSLRDKTFIEGNCKDRSVFDIWNDPNAFKWRRKLSQKQLTGFCASCRYGSLCLGGCTAIRFATEGSVCSENKLCAYHEAVSGHSTHHVVEQNVSVK